MKVFHLIASLGHGGAEVLLVGLLARLKQQGVSVAAISVSEEVPLRGRLESEGVPVHTLGHEGSMYALLKMARLHHELRRILISEQPNIVHSHLYLPDILSRVAAPLSCKLITTLHGEDRWWAERTRVRSLGKTWLDGLTGWCRRVHYVSVSEDVRGKAGRALKIPMRRHRVIHNGVDTARFPFVPRTKSERPTVLQIGRFYPEKGHAVALKAFALLLTSHPGVRLVLVGDGPLRSELESQARQLRLVESVVFAGVRDDVRSQLEAADILWMPSEREGLGLACLEAMASGLPVVATAVGGLCEAVSDGETGFLIPPGNPEALASRTALLLNDFALARRFGTNGHRRVEKLFSIDSTVSRYHESYEDLVAGRW